MKEKHILSEEKTHFNGHIYATLGCLKKQQMSPIHDQYSSKGKKVARL